MTINNSEEIKNHWDKIGDKYQDIWHSLAQKIMSRWETDFIKKWIAERSPAELLDLGIGNGRIIEAISDKSKNDANIRGLDISFEMVQYCKQKFANNLKIKELKMLESNAILDVYDKKFDFITSIRVIKYNKNWEQMLKQLFELLNNNGVIVFSMPNKKAITGLLRTNITYVRVDPAYIKRLARKNNMEILEIKGFSRIPDYFYKIDNYYISKLVIFGDKLLQIILGKYFLSREVFYVLLKK